MAVQWLSKAKKHDLSGSRGNGPFNRSRGTSFLGVILHVNVSGRGSNGTSEDFFVHNEAQVLPNFQVYSDGSMIQFLPIDWQPWCQIDGNFNYAAIETGGNPEEPLTMAQMISCAYIINGYRATMGMKMFIADKPGDLGLGTHQMGGQSWGGHACPGVIRANQRKDILARVIGAVRPPTGIPPSKDDAMSLTKDDLDSLKTMITQIVHSELNHINTDEGLPRYTASIVKRYVTGHDYADVAKPK